MIDYILSPQSVEALGWTLLHSLWQGAVFAILLAVLFIALRSYTAQSRYVVATGLLTAFFVTVGATFWLQWQEASNRVELAARQSESVPTELGFGFDETSTTAMKTGMDGAIAQSKHAEVATADQSHWLTALSEYYERHLPLLVTFWLLGVLFLQLRFLGQVAYVQRLKHYGTQLFPTSWSDKIEELESKLRIQKTVRYLTSLRIESPMVIGWLKPVVLMPRQLLQSLSETEIYAVLAHELAHIRREDFVVNLMQTLLCNVFFFHPGVWWMSNRVDDEREHCCDDLAVAATGQAASYAKTLINVSELQLARQSNAPLAVAFSGTRKQRERGGFAGRIRRLFMVSNGAGTFREGFATACILFAALIIGIAATGHTVQAKETQETSNIEKENDRKTGTQESDIVAVTEIESISEGDTLKKVNRFGIEGERISNRRETPELSVGQTKESDILVVTEIKSISEGDSQSKVNRFGIEGERISNRRELPEPPAGQIETQNGGYPISYRTEPIAAPEPPAEPMGQAEARIDALVMACAEGDFDFVKTLVKSGIDINGIGSEGFTPLMTAASENEHEIVNYLIKKGADVNQVSEGWTALIEAADEGSLESMKHLLKAGANVNYYISNGSPTAISMAASEGHLDCLKLLLENGADINGIGKSIPPLHIAAEEDKRDIVDYLISRKVDINKKDAAGRTALMYAASEGQEYMVEILLEGGADKSIVDSYGATARDYAIEEDEYDARDYLDTEKRPDIHQATLDGKMEKVQRMVERGTDVNARDDYGRTALHIASAENHNIDMQLLINLGADVNVQDQQGRTPLMYAAADGLRDAAVLLVSRIADVNIQDADGMRALEWALNGGNSDLVNFLGLITESKEDAPRQVYGRNSKNRKTQEELDKRSEKASQKEFENGSKKQSELEKRLEKATQKEQENRSKKQSELEKRVSKAVQKESVHRAKDGLHIRQFDIKNEGTELMYAARNGSLAECQQLIANGSNVNATDGTGQTALMVASMSNRIENAKLLIENGADVNMSSTSGVTALHYAALENHDQIARLLLNNNARVDATMRYSSSDGNTTKELIAWEYIGATPLLIAVEANNVEIARALITAGANPDHRLTKIEYRLKKGSSSYLGLSEVIGIDEAFKQDAEINVSDDSWTPKRQAQQMNKSELLNLFPK